jgi:4-hydroxybenzoate polyprenyltransferase
MFLNIIRNFQTFYGNSTLKLLTISIFISISGIFRVYLSYIILNSNINLLICLGSGLIVYSVYTLDRVLSTKEDEINQIELMGSNKKIGLAVSSLTFIVGCYIFASVHRLEIALFPFIVGYFYNKGLNFGKYSIKLKGSYGIKNLVVGITWSIFIVGSTGYSFGLPLLVVFLFMCSKSFINSTINDFKDVDGDILSGLRTLPIALGKQKTRNLLLGLLVFSNLVLYASMVREIISFNYTILICSIACGLFGIFSYENTLSWFSKGIRDGESLITILANILVSILIAFDL